MRKCSGAFVAPAPSPASSPPPPHHLSPVPAHPHTSTTTLTQLEQWTQTGPKVISACADSLWGVALGVQALARQAIGAA